MENVLLEYITSLKYFVCKNFQKKLDIQIYYNDKAILLLIYTIPSHPII